MNTVFRGRWLAGWVEQIGVRDQLGNYYRNEGIIGWEATGIKSLDMLYKEKRLDRIWHLVWSWGLMFEAWKTKTTGTTENSEDSKFEKSKW